MIETYRNTNRLFLLVCFKRTYFLNKSNFLPCRIVIRVKIKMSGVYILRNQRPKMRRREGKREGERKGKMKEMGKNKV